MSVEIGSIHITRVHHACLIPLIFFVVADNMYLYFSVTRRDTCLDDSTKGFKRIKVVDLLQLQELRIIPVGVYIISIKHHCLLMITRNIHPKIDIIRITLLLSLGILKEAVHLISVLHIEAEIISSRIVPDP